MPWSLQTLATIVYYIPLVPSAPILPLSGAGSVTSGGGTIIMVGRGTNSIASYDIATGTWSLPSIIFSSSGHSVAYGNQKYVAVGEGTNTVAISNDGLTWGTISSPPFSGAGYDIVYAGSTWVAVGQGTNSVAYFDGTSWISINNGVGRDYTSKNYTLRYTLNSDTVSGTRLLNDATGIYDASLVNGATINAFSKYGGGSLYVNNTGNWNAATTQHVRLPTINITSSGFTVSLWIYPINTDSFVFDFGVGSSYGMTLQVVPNLNLRLFPNGAIGGNFVQSSSSITLNQWTHCCIIVTSSEFISIYANGVLYVSQQSPVSVFGTKTTSILGSSLLTNPSFNGYIDEFITYPRAITAAEVADLYNSSSLSTGYGLYYDASVPRLWATGAGLNTMAYASAANGTWTGSLISNMTQVNAVGSSTLLPTMVVVGYGTSVVNGNSPLAVYSTNYSSVSPTYTSTTRLLRDISCSGGDALAYGNGIFVWGGTPGTGGSAIATSRDNGISWTRASQSLTNLVNKIMYIGGKFYAVGNRVGTSAGTVITSIDGSNNWVSLQNRGVNYDPFASNGGQGIGYNDISNTILICGLGNPQIIRSSNLGGSWTTVAGALFTTGARAIGYGNGVWVATGNTGNVIARSVNDGTSFTLLTTTINGPLNIPVGGKTNDVKFNRDIGLTTGTWLVGYNNSVGNVILSKSRDNGVTWSSLFNNTAGSMTSVNRIYSDGTKWYISGAGAVGFQFAYSNANNPSGISDFTFISQHSGVSWSMGGGDIAVSTSTLSIAGGIGTNNLQLSYDGNTWSSTTSPFSVAVNDVKNNGSLWVAVGEGGNTIATSTDGTTWTGRGTSTFSLRGNKVRWNSAQSRWYAVGEGTNTLASSTDGITWTGISTTGFVDVSGMGLTFNL
jgi:hypothetical protein